MKENILLFWYVKMHYQVLILFIFPLRLNLNMYLIDNCSNTDKRYMDSRKGKTHGANWREMNRMAFDDTVYFEYTLKSYFIYNL